MPPSSALLCHWQSQWVWGPSGYGAILLVNCDKDDLNCNEQDNHDQHVRSLQGEGPGARVPGSPGSLLRYPAGTPIHRGGSEGRSRGHNSNSRACLVFLKTRLGLAAAPPNTPSASRQSRTGRDSGNELPTFLSLWSREC